MLKLAFASLVVVGCTDVDPLVALRDGNIVVTVQDDSYPPAASAPSEVSVALTEYGQQDATPACIRIRTSSTITANAEAGTLVTAGHYDDNGVADTLECYAPTFDVMLPTHPPTIDMVITDGTGSVTITIGLDNTEHYTIVTTCTAAACNA